MSDFILAPDLAALTGTKVKSLYQQRWSGKGDLAPILTKFNGRLGAWRADYDALVASRRRLRDSAAA